ncbi:cytochrome P450 [Chromohalobacter canadensis]|uniref:cytochrome P450 n=1 Tax=Chromohalobacter canadensis TaxID=141389 RepID=UPI0021BE0031|nr:cytochrome P450 [Chromohalobacter canadensis]MCT8468575.1 cytochrome P450 [Chromohalobacter canadensis]MCT8471630.1 cytochrome P450 [Chromohalobacter canadensis]MCT8499083.1 cytochrome P450 [Chromohalobacter canadensis]
MSEYSPHQDWDPRDEAVLDDQRAAYDTMRRRCPVAFSDYMQWSLFRHADVWRVLEDHATFSNAVSRHLSVPNAMNPPEHARFRRLIEPYFAPGPMRDFEPLCRDIADKLVDALPAEGEIEAMADLGQPFALQVQCTFMGWPDELHAPLQDWVTRQQTATLAGDREALIGLAQEFDSVIRGLLEERRLAGAQAPDDVTTRLMRERVDGRTLSDEETISIIRNWTAGELGTISACVGILLRYLAEHTDLQMRLRREPELLPAAIDEILRMDAPLMSNRRIATCPVTLGGRRIEAGERLTVLWGSANRDEAVFGDPDAFRLDRDPDLNLLYGAGIHVCPGAPLARMELRLFLQALLDRTQVLAAVADKPAVRAHFPAGGYSRVWTQVQR